MSWFRSIPYHPLLSAFLRFVDDVTNPYLNLFRRFIPPARLGPAAVDLAKEWRTDRMLRRLDSLLVVADKDHTIVISGNGDLLEPDDGVAGIGSGGPYAVAAARALLRHAKLDAKAIAEESLKIAAEICVYTNSKIRVEELG